MNYIHSVTIYNEEKHTQSGKQPAACIKTFGCQQNVSDSEKLKGLLEMMGYTFTDDPEEAALIIFNTCAVRENAEHRIFGNVGALKALKKQKPDTLIALCGCMMQQKHIADKIKDSFPYVDMVFGTHALPRLPEFIAGRLGGSKRIFSVEDSDGEITEDLPTLRDREDKASVPIMYGCDNFCTYCVVPLVRGRERSREPAKILEEISGLIAAGYKEITLLGQNVNSYKGNGDINFSALLRKINALDGDFKIRFMTSHPKDCTKELIDTIAACDKICNHIHLPLQSGSDRILSAMNRGYTVGEYMQTIAYAKSQIPDVAFTGDMIVGFPGEGREDFEKTLDAVKKVGYRSLFTFIYSPRVGTAAADMPDPTPAEEKSKWFRELLTTQAEIEKMNSNTGEY